MCRLTWWSPVSASWCGFLFGKIKFVSKFTLFVKVEEDVRCDSDTWMW